MPIKDIEKRREYQRNWMANRRAEFFEDKFCDDCGSKEKLELHHKNRDEKVTHRVWSWSLDRRKEETSKCSILCFSCHKIRTQEQFRKIGPENTSWCTDCKDFINISLFGPSKKNWDGFRSICNPCRKERGWENATSRKDKPMVGDGTTLLK